jgi:glycolate oxidase
MRFLPECVVFPGSPLEVAEILKLANRERFPVFPRGAGTGMVGAALPRSGGVAMVMVRLNKILEIDQNNMIAVVEPGVITGEFQRQVSKYGLFYPPDPASLQFSTIGGNAAMCAGGPRAVKYGVTRDYVLGLQVVLPTGEIIRTGTRTQKGVVGYDLTRLMVGSEGTLGIFTQIILRLIPAPESVRTLLAVFPVLENAARTVSEIIRHRIIPSTLELMDQSAVEVVETYLNAGLPIGAQALLLIEVDGPDRILDEDAAAIADICLGCGASEVETARSGEDRDRLWKARRAISPALRQIKPDKINEDVTVPRSQIPALIQFIRALAEKYHLTIVNFGHAGDGNIHTNIMLDKSDEDEAGRAEMAVEELFRAVLNLGGTLSGEHGIGIAKSPFIEMEVGREGLQAMLKIKQALDPLDVLNPGKMFVADRAFFKKY